MIMPVYKYHAFGLDIKSDWPLPSLAVAEFDKADLDIYHDKIAGYLDDDWETSRKIYKNWEALPGKFLMKVNNVASYYVIGGKQVVIERAHKDVHDDAVTAYLMGSIMAAVLQQRDITLLHGSSVKMGDSAVIFTGKSGAGKSTLVSKFMSMGYSLITDDVVAIAKNEEDQLCVTPAFPTARLWADSLEKLSYEGNVKKKVRAELDKFLISADQFCSHPQPIETIYILNQHNENSIKIETLPLIDRHHNLSLQGFRNGFLRGHKSFPSHFKMMMELANRIPVFNITRPRNGFELDGLVQAIIAHNIAQKEG